MSKWADYCISKVRYDVDHEYIDQVKVHVDKGDNLSSATTEKRSWVVDKIESGKTFITVTTNKEGDFLKGQEIHIIKVNGKKFLRTDQNSTENDNLENLPEF